MRWYVGGLLSEVERKNGWTLAEAVGDAGPEGLQWLLNFYAWDTAGVRVDVRAAVVEAIGDAENGVVIVDETGFLKKGMKFRRSGPPVLRRGGADRELTDRCVPGLLVVAGAGVDRPGVVLAEGLDRGSGTVSCGGNR